ncbi:MAG: hypothetical protein EAZ92_14950 [Candidatus Kapaibacterium sp.]|nr:MAG: hypothetical protein EAZ92_14950 [Candidatus Kapabacteria bacterium]
METLVYHLNKTDLNAAFLDTIRSSIDAERIKVVIESEEQSLLDVIEANRRAEYDYSIAGEDFAAMVEASEQDEQYDIIGAIVAHKRSKH